MKFFNHFLFILYFVCIPFAGTLAQENSSYFFHTIEKGQSLYSISSMYNVNQADIIAINPGCEEKIYAGQTLKIPQQKGSKQERQFHTIQPQETLYQLTIKYKVSAKEICDANPGLSAQNFQIGKVIIIPTLEDNVEKTNAPVAQEGPKGEVKPRCKEMHKVNRKETIFSVSRQYGITEKELIAANPELKNGMKKGDYLCIPYPSTDNSREEVQKQTTEPPKSNRELFSSNRKLYKKYKPIKAAIILPFMLDNAAKRDKRMIEYYEGFLMAVDSLKRTGVSIDLYTYDSGNTSASLKAILDKKELQEMNIIFGPHYSFHVKPLAEFAKKHDIHLVIPFSSKENEVFNNPMVYQINTPQSYLYSEVYEHFIRKFGNYNIVLLGDPNADKEKAEFIKGFKQELKNKGISFHAVGSGASSEAIKKAIDPAKENIIVLTSASNVTLIKTLPQLTMIVREHPEYKISIFGYPEWQTYTKDHLAGFYELDTYFYSSFYTNNLFPQAVRFTSQFRKLYSKDMSDRVPRYEMLGFDTGYFFLYGLSRYGSDFADDIDKVRVTPIQTGFKFERVNNWGGFINKKVFFIHFTKDFELVKLDFE